MTSSVLRKNVSVWPGRLRARAAALSAAIRAEDGVARAAEVIEQRARS